MNPAQTLRKLAFAALLFHFFAVNAIASNIPENAVWIDVRTPKEFNSGHVPAAHSIPFDRIEAGVAELKLAKDTPIYLYCAVGGRAAIAKKKLDALGYGQVTNVGGLKDAQGLLSN